MRRRELIVGTGAVLALPRAVRAEQAAPRRVGVLMSTAESEAHEQAAIAAFVQQLEDAGWVAGQNIEVAYRWGAGDPERMAANAREMVALAPDVIVTKGANLPALAPLTTTIPIIFVLFSDAVVQKYATSIARPGGNITGFTSGERDLVGKRLQLLREIAPAITHALYIRSRRTGSDSEALFARLAADAAASGFTVGDGAVQDADEIEPLLAGFAHENDGGLVIAFDAFNTTHSALLVGLAAKFRLPAIYPGAFYANAGGLISYGFDQDDQFRKAASYVDRVLKGARVGDLPIQEPTRFQLAINGNTARTLGLSVPPILLAQADEVIE